MSYYGPASEPNPKPRNRTTLPPPYDYSKHGNPDDRPAIAMHRAGHFNRHNKRLRKHTRVVPWRDEWELQSVGKALLSVLDEDGGNGGVDDRPGDEDGGCPLPLPPTQISSEEAFATIAVWKSRLASADGLPQAIESTAALAAVYRRDSQRRIHRRSRSRLRSTLASTSTSTLMPMPMPMSMAISMSMSMSMPGVTELRLAYSAAIVRCINGFADSLQQQRAMAASVSNLCGQLGIPSWLVDTRHESSHNALPNLEVLRLSASTLLEFLRELFWIPRCAEWHQGGNGNGNGGEQPPGAGHQAEVQGPIPDPSPIDCLVRYKACASTWATTRSTTTIENNSNETKTKGGRATGKRKKKTPPKTTILPYDPLFGEVGTFSSSDEDNENDNDNDDDDDEDTENSTEDNVDLGKPAVNSFWGSSVGTNINRYFLLEPPKKKKKKGKEKKKKTPKKAIQNNPKKKKGEKSPNDCARLFVRSVPSLQEGYAIAIRYLVWGGVGGAPDGRGVLIPGSKIAFPASPQGVSKCWQRYSPLVHVVCRTWPGFAAHMTTHLVDCVLSIEDGGSIVHDNGTETGTDNHNDNDNDNDNDNHNGNRQPKERQGLDPGSIRKLYFLYAWIRLMLSQRFMAALDPNFSVTTTNAKNSNPLDLPLAKLEHLESLGYPLNSLLDRLRRSDNPHRADSNDVNDSQSMGTSRDIIRNLETILGPKRSRGFGYPEHEAAATRDASSAIEPSSVSHSPESQDASTATSGADVGEHRAGQMSLDDMEAMLLSEDKSDSGERGGEMETEAASASASASASAHHGDKVEKGTSMPIESSAKASTTSMQPAEEEHELRTLPKQRRPAWIRCERWDACAIGALPGYPC